MVNAMTLRWVGQKVKKASIFYEVLMKRLSDKVTLCLVKTSGERVSPAKEQTKQRV